MNAKPAQGTEGFVIYTGNGNYVFRVYGGGFSFMDYDITISDMMIKIIDDDAYLYEKNGKFTLDYSPDTLGLK